MGGSNVTARWAGGRGIVARESVRRFWDNRDMERKRVNASTIRSAGYDPGERVLEIEFTSGSIVQYSGVSPEVYRQFVNAPSPGSFFQDKIDENFPSRRVR